MKVQTTGPANDRSKMVKLPAVILLAVLLFPRSGFAQDSLPHTNGSGWRFVSANDLHLGDLVIARRWVDKGWDLSPLLKIAMASQSMTGLSVVCHSDLCELPTKLLPSL
jgi:hypothetical protein